MNCSERDHQILLNIVRHCREVESALKRFGGTREDFMKDSVFLNACSMPILQIGELAKRLSPETMSSNPNIPWRQIKGMRDFFVHDYLSMDKAAIWETATKGVPELMNQCHALLKESEE